MMRKALHCCALACLASLYLLLLPSGALSQTYLDNETQYSNQDPLTETRRSDHYRMVFGHYDRDGANLMSEQYAQGNLQMHEQCWNRWVNELGMHDINTSPSHPEMGLRKTNFNFLMTWDDGGGGGCYMSTDSNGFSYCMGNPVNCRYDPPSGATPHEMGHVWEGTTGGFNGSDSSGAWWECTANWMQLQFLNSYPQATNTLNNAPLYPCHGRDYYDTWMIWETALNDARYGAAWVNSIWTNATADQQAHEYILDRMVRLDASGSADKTAGMRDLWGDMTKKMVTWDFSRQRWLAQNDKPDDGSDWGWARSCRAVLIPMPLNNGWYRPAREHTPLGYGFNMVKLTVTAGTTVGCNFQPVCDPVRQSDWRACLVAVSNNGDARYSSLWNIGTNSITLSSDESKLYLVVIATPKPMKINNPAWQEMMMDSGLQFPYTVSFTNATPANIVYPAQSHTGMHQHANGGGWVSDTATVDSTAYVGPNAQVLNSAQVRGYARIDDYAVVRSSAQIRDNAVVTGHAIVQDTAQVYGNAKVRDWAQVGGNAQVYENAMVFEHATVQDNNNVVHGSAICKGITYLYSPSNITGSIIMEGDTANGGTGDHGVHFGWQWGENQSIIDGLTDNGYQYCGLTFERDNPVFACDQYGIMHGFEMNGCKSTIDSGGTPRGGYVLALNGTNQYVELPNSVNDFKDMSIAAWVKWTGTANDQKIWSMGDGSSKQMYLTPKNSSTSRVRFSISDGATTQYIDGAAALGTGWTHVVVTFSGNTGTLYVNGAQAGQNTSMTLDSDALNAPLMENKNYIGRDGAGNYFQGSVDDFKVYNKTLSSGEVTTLYNTAAPSPVTPPSDTTAPTPNAATWLVAPTAVSDSAITMSATPGTDASNYVAYSFTCTAGGGHNSGWISMNRYTDVGLNPSTQYTYTVQMRDKYGNTGTASSALAATTQTSSPGTASFAYGPVGISSSAITMTATKVSNSSGLTEYKFTRNDAVTSGWQSSPKWTNTSLTTNNTYTYTVQIRDGRGNTSTVSSAVGATVRDMAAPTLAPVAHWQMQPYATIDNKVSMTAMTPDTSDASGVQYYFHCTAGGAPDSSWQDSATYVTPSALGDGNYSFQYKVRDKSAQYNESGYSSTYTAKITPTTGYHAATFAQTGTLPDDYLVTFNGLVLRANTDNYVVKDVGSSSTITVKTAAYGQATSASNVLKICQIKGHLWTLGGTRLVTYATVTPLMDPPSFAVSGKVSNASGGAGIPGATVYFSNAANASVDPLATTTTDLDGNYSQPMPNGQWYVSASAPNFLPSSDQTVTVNGYPVTNLNFSLNGCYTITASAGSGGSISPSGAVLVNSGANQSFTITASGGYSIAGVTVDGVNQGSVSSYTFSNVTANHTISATFTANSRNIPQQASLIDSAVTDTLPASGIIANWASFMPTGKTYNKITNPTVGSINLAKSVSVLRTSSDGFDCGDHGSTSIPCNGASIVTVVKPTRNTTGDSWNSIVDVFYDRLVLGIYNNTGQVMVRRNGSFEQTGYSIPDGQVTVLSLVVQSNGNYKVYANGTQVYSNTNTSTMTSLVPGVAGGFATHITVGRNWPDGWTGFNGNFGDFFLYSIALSDADRQTLESDLTAKFGAAPSRTITASAGTGGSISPSGSVSVPNGNSATFVALPNIGYAVSQMTVDSVNQGAISSYTFTNVQANHTISASFTTVPTYTITASAGANGSISPSGAVVVNSGSSKTFTITPNAGYSVSQVTVDSVNQGAITTYTFNNITANHTISATFAQQTNTITASAATGGSISPTGAVVVNYGANQTFTITPNANYAISSVNVDGVDVGAVTSYTFNTVTAAHTISAVFIAGARNIPGADKMLFSLDTKDLPSSGAITSWPWLWPTGTSTTNIGTPTAETLSGVKWEHNVYTDYEGLRIGNYTTAIPVNGASIVTVVKPTRSTDSGNWRSIVDCFYSQFCLCITNNTGQVGVRRKGSMDWAPSGNEVPDGQITVLSLVAQPDGTYKVWANGTQIMSIANTSTLTNLDPLWNGGGTGFWSYIDVGRNDPDGWTTFNGDIGDVFFYKAALSDAQRQRLEADIKSKFGIGSATFTITASAGTGGTISPSGAVQVNSGADQTFAITPNASYAISNVTIDGVSVGVASSYTFTSVTSNHTISATFVATGNFTITASAGTGGTIAPNGAVVVSPGANQTFTITPNTGYGISSVTVDSVNQGSINTYTFTNVQANHTITAAFTALGRDVPKSDQLLFSAVTDSFPSSGSTGNWATFWPTGGTLTMMATPVVDTIGGVKWEQNLNADGDGYVLGNYSSAIAVNGATIVVAVKPVMTTTSHDWDWRSAVDIFYNRLAIGVRNWDGLICVRRNGSLETSAAAIPDGLLTVLSLVVQPDGAYKVWANGTQVMNVASNGAFTSLDPLWNGGTTGYWSYINVGRNNPDGWTVFNGDIGDVFVYKTALSDADRQTLEDDLISKFGIGTYTITASAGTGGSISPNGVVAVDAGTSQTFDITPNADYVISQVAVDGVNQGAISSYTFTNVTANHTISATFAANQTFTITASSDANGSISPSGAVLVNYGDNQTFNMTANSGYRVSRVLVDGVNVGAVTSYTFTNVTANHTISVEYISTDFVAYYKFDEISGTSAYDWSGNGYAGTLYGSCSWVAGKTNNAVSIPGGTSYVGLPSGIVNSLTNWTVVTWVKLTTVSTNMRIFDFGSSTTNYLSLTPKHANSQGKIQFYIRNTAGTAFYVRGTAALPTGSWQHVAVTQSGNTVTLYVQGVQRGQITNCTLNPNSLGSTNNNYIGNSQTSSHPHLNGLVDGFRIYNRALTSTEISNLYGGGAGAASFDDPGNDPIIIPAIDSPEQE